MDIVFTTRDYEWVHGHKPRGRGYWFFTFEGMEFPVYGTFTEAKRLCTQHIKSIAPHGYRSTVYVNVET